MKVNNIIVILSGLLFSSLILANEKAPKNDQPPANRKSIAEIIHSEELILESILNDQAAALAQKYREKALNGDADSAFMLGLLYKKSGELEQCELLRDKTGLAQTGSEARDCVKQLHGLYRKWVRIAARRNQPFALFEMALIHDRRNAIKYNKYKRLSKRSLYWVKKAAARGEPRAIGFLAQYERVVED